MRTGRPRRHADYSTKLAHLIHRVFTLGRAYQAGVQHIPRFRDMTTEEAEKSLQIVRLHKILARRIIRMVSREKK